MALYFAVALHADLSTHALDAHALGLLYNGQIVGDSALLELANGCSSALLQLDLSSCGFVTDAGLLGMLLKCPGLTDLGLSGCGQISDQACIKLHPWACT